MQFVTIGNSDSAKTPDDAEPDIPGPAQRRHRLPNASKDSLKITSITQQVKRHDRYSVFVSGNYSFSLSEGALLESGIHSGMELTLEQVNDYKKLSADDKLYALALRYVAMRMRSTGDVRFYLERKKGAPPALADSILNKLSIIGLLDDDKYAASFVADRRMLKPTSRRKLVMELRQKHIANDIIETVIGSEVSDERAALNELITRKRRQTKYQDDNKLMQYLARQGFGYGDIKLALSKDEDY